MKKIICLVLATVMVVGMLTGCGVVEEIRHIIKDEEDEIPPLFRDFNGRQVDFGFSAQPSEELTLSDAGAAQVKDTVQQQKPDYIYSPYYDLDTVRQRLKFDATVEKHQYCAAPEGTLSGGYLLQLVKENNRIHLEENDFGFEVPDDEYLQELCDFLADVVNETYDRYPDLDWDRIWCNFGRLKILYDVGMLSYAQVSSDMVLGVSKHNTQTVLRLKGEDGFTKVLIHECMHILQMGCSCENIENCSRRAGIALYYDDYTLNLADWTWLVEGSAERQMMNLTGKPALTYQYKTDYICSMTMSVLLREDVRADSMEAVCFYADPDMLFDLYGCQTQEQRDELILLMVTMNILQMQPTAFYEYYKEQTGIDLNENEEALNEFSYSLKPAVCLTLARAFYNNLVDFMQENPLTVHDLFCLINLFEGHLNQHMRFSREDLAEVNKPFVAGYLAMRQALFAALEQENPGLDLELAYGQYDITASGEKLLNAQLSMLPEQKRQFLAERAQWQDEMMELGVKVSG